MAGSIKREDCAYAAGIVDGEGTITIATTRQNILSRGAVRSYKSYQMVVRVTNTSPDLITYLQSTFGGWVITNKPKSPQCKQYWTWQLATKSALPFLRLVLPYLRIKHRQARAAISFQEGIRSTGSRPVTEEEYQRRDMLVSEIRSLNKRGACRAAAVFPRLGPRPNRKQQYETAGAKLCLMCKAHKPISEFYFVKSKNMYHSWCKNCNNRYTARQHREARNRLRQAREAQKSLTLGA